MRCPGLRFPICHRSTGLVFGSPNGLTNAEKNHNGDVLRDWASKHRNALGLDPNLPLTVPSFHPVFRTKDNGRLRVEMVVEVIQSRQAPFDPAVPEAGSFPFRAGVTLIVEAPELTAGPHGHTVARAPKVRFAIGRDNDRSGCETARAEATQLCDRAGPCDRRHHRSNALPGQLWLSTRGVLIMAARKAVAKAAKKTAVKTRTIGPPASPRQSDLRKLRRRKSTPTTGPGPAGCARRQAPFAYGCTAWALAISS